MYKDSLLDCLETIKNDADKIISQIMDNACNANIEIIIKPMEIVRYALKVEHYSKPLKLFNPKV